MVSAARAEYQGPSGRGLKCQILPLKSTQQQQQRVAAEGGKAEAFSEAPKRNFSHDNLFFVPTNTCQLKPVLLPCDKRRMQAERDQGLLKHRRRVIGCNLKSFFSFHDDACCCISHRPPHLVSAKSFINNGVIAKSHLQHSDLMSDKMLRGIRRLGSVSGIAHVGLSRSSSPNVNVSILFDILAAAF